MGYRVSANYKNVDESHLENVNKDGTSIDGDKGYAVRGKLLWELSDTTDVIIIADYGSNQGPEGVHVVRSASEPVKRLATSALPRRLATTKKVRNRHNHCTVDFVL